MRRPMHFTLSTLALVVALMGALLVVAPPSPASAQADEDQILVFSRTAGLRLVS